jgi:hypothetical protein
VAATVSPPPQPPAAIRANGAQPTAQPGRTRKKPQVHENQQRVVPELHNPPSETTPALCRALSRGAIATIAPQPRARTATPPVPEAATHRKKSRRLAAALALIVAGDAVLLARSLLRRLRRSQLDGQRNGRGKPSRQRSRNLHPRRLTPRKARNGDRAQGHNPVLDGFCR